MSPHELLLWLTPPGESIGAPACPLMHRWTLLDRLGVKLLVHHFMPNASDPDCHDHPSPFITLVLRGCYEDIVPCKHCDGIGTKPGARLPCYFCRGRGNVLGETMRAGMVRRRRARHCHLTRTGDRGAWTLVLMGPKRRAWGFMREGRWWPVRRYEERFGFHMRCESESGQLLRNTRWITFEDIRRASQMLGLPVPNGNGGPPARPEPGPPRPPEPPHYRPVD